jgi:hypothetical protein
VGALSAIEQQQCSSLGPQADWVLLGVSKHDESINSKQQKHVFFISLSRIGSEKTRRHWSIDKSGFTDGEIVWT